MDRETIDRYDIILDKAYVLASRYDAKLAQEILSIILEIDQFEIEHDYPRDD